MCCVCVRACVCVCVCVCAFVRACVGVVVGVGVFSSCVAVILFYSLLLNEDWLPTTLT